MKTKLDGIEIDIPDDTIRELYAQLPQEPAKPGRYRPRPGEMVEVSDDENDWYMLVFYFINNHSQYMVSGSGKVASPRDYQSWRYCRPLSWQTLLITCAPPGAKWGAVDANGDAYWYKDEPRMESKGWRGICCRRNGNFYRIHVGKQPDWSQCMIVIPERVKE